MRRATAPVAVLCLFLGTPRLLPAQSSLLYRETTGPRQVLNRISEEDLPDGYVMRSRLSDGDMHDVRLDKALLTVSYHVTSPARRIDYTVVRTGDTLIVDGTFGGRPVAKRIAIDQRPWYESLERSVRDLVTGRSRGPLVFWIVNPWDANAYLVQARTEGDEQVSVDGDEVDAVRLRVVPVGILRFFWSALYWFRPADGRFERSEGVRGGPGTPKTVVELLDKG